MSGAIRALDSGRWLRIGLVALLAAALTQTSAFAQTNPAAQALPYTQDFRTLASSSNVYPAGWQGWINGAPGAAFLTTGPTADQALTVSSTAATTTGGVHNYNGKIGPLDNGTNDYGLGLAVNTTGFAGVVVSYEVMTIRNPYDGTTNTRINEIALQYRVGTAGAWTTLAATAYQNNTTTQNTATVTPQNLAYRSVTLPPDCDNQAVVQLRWAQQQVSGAGSRPGFAIDNVAVQQPAAGGQATALEFDGVNDYVTFGQAPGLGASNFTIETWFRRTGAGVTTSTGASGISAILPLVAKGFAEADNSVADMNYILGINTAGNVLAVDYEEGTGQTSPGLNHPLSGTTPLLNNAWYHAAATFDGTTLRIYLNGVLEGTLVVGASRLPQSASIQHATLATALNSTGGIGTQTLGLFQGQLDEARIWNVARSACDIANSMNLELTSGTGLLARWGMHDGAGSLLSNSLATPNGILMNGPAWVAGSTFDAPVIPPPAAPTGLSATALDGGQVQLAWTDIAVSESGYEIERSTSGPSGPFTPLATLGVNATGYVDAWLSPSSEYCYRVRAISTCAAPSAYADVACATTTADLANALDFSPSSSTTGAYVNFGNPSALKLGAFTLELWFRRDGTGYSITTGTGGVPDAIPLLAKGTSEAEDVLRDINYFLGIKAGTNTLCADFEANPGSVNQPIVGARVIGPGWHHAAVTYDGAWKLYLDGVLDAQLAVGLTPGNLSNSVAVLASSITSVGAAQGYFDGATDEVRIWDHARTQLEIQDNVNNQINAAQSGLVGRWSLNEGSGTTVYGTAGTGLNGSIVGATPANWTRTGGAPFDVVVTHDIVASVGAGGSIMPPGTTAVPHRGSQLYLIVPNPGFHVVEVLVDGLPQGPIGSYTFSDVTGNHTISATFALNTYALNVTTAGTGSGSVAKVPDQALYDHGSLVQLTATPDPGSTFTGWSGDASGMTNPLSVTMDAAKNITATFTLNSYALNVTTAGTGSGSVAKAPDQALYDHGSLVQLTATPDPGSTFTGWSGDASGMTNPLSVTMDGSKAITANFASSAPAVVSAVSPAGVITPANPTRTIPVTIARSTFTPLRAYSIEIELVSLQLTGLPAASITEGSYLSDTGSPTTLQIIDLGGGKYRVDCAILGSVPACGSSAPAGTLFEVQVGSALPYGTGSLTVTNVILRDCDNVGLPGSVGTAATVPIDNAAPVVTVSAPNGGESWPVGSSQSILWTATDAAGVTAVDLAYSTDGGTTFPYTIALGEANDGSFTWTVPNTPTVTAIVRVTAHDTNANPGSDISDAVFSIVRLPLVVTLAGNGSGAVGKAPDQPDYAYGDLVTLTATPNPGSTFTGWSGDASGATNPLVVTMDAAKAITATFVSGGAALSFNGTNQHVTFGAAPSLGASRFTLELWFKKTGAGVVASTGSGGVNAVPLLTKGRGEADGSNVDCNYFLGIDAAGHLIADYEEGTGQLSPGLNHPVIGATVLANDVWYHGAAVFDGSSLKLYLNGELDGTTAGLAGRNPQSASIQHAGLATAFSSTGVPAGFFAGDLDEARVWGVARTQCDIVAAMNLELTLGTGLLGRWGLNEGFGPTAANSVVAGPAGTLVNAPAWVADAPFDLVPPTVPPPAAPGGVSAMAYDAVQNQVFWTDSSLSEDGFEITRSSSGAGGPFMLLATVGSNVTTFVDAPLVPGEEYCYQVRAIGCVGPSAYTVAVCVPAPVPNCNALDFDPNGAATKAYVRVGNVPALQLSAFTIEAWVRRDGAGIGTATASGGVTDAVPLVTRGRSDNDTPANNVNYFIGIRQSTGTLCADFEEGETGPTPGVSHPIVGTNPVPIGSWHHVAATYDGVEWRLYLDGNLEGQLAVNRPLANTSAMPVVLASALNSTSTAAGYFDGAMDEVRIWNVARSQGDIQASMSQNITAPTPGLVGRWGLDENAGTIAYGSAGTSHHGTIVGTAVTNWSRTACWSMPVGVDTEVTSDFGLQPVTPNPAVGRISIGFALARGARVELDVIDVAGRRVAQVAARDFPAGTHRLEWSGRSSTGAPAVAGVYFLRMSAGGRAFTRRFVLIR